MTERIILAMSHMSPAASPEAAWYHAGGLAAGSFGVQTREGRWLELLQIRIPAPLTSLVPDPEHETGASLRLAIKWPAVLGFDFGPFLDTFGRTIAEICSPLYGSWPTPLTPAEVEHQRRVQFAGWCRLVAIWLATGHPPLAGKPLPGLDSQALFWEEYLYQEMCDFPWLQTRPKGAAAVIAAADDRREYRAWLRIASCAAELLWRAPEARALWATVRIAPQLFPCLTAGLAAARQHGGVP